MDERILKWITGISAALTVAVCVSMQFFPDMHERAVLAAERQIQANFAKKAEVISSPDPQEVVVAEESESWGSRLRIELPSGLQEDELTIRNDYLTQVVYVRFANGVDDFFEQYRIRGSSDHIASISYYKDQEDGVIELGLDRVYELQSEYDDGELYLQFLDPHEVYDKVVVVDAGHGKRAVGAVKKGISEKNIDLAILLELKKLFDKDTDNIGVYYTRTTDVNPTLDQRVQLANKSGADLFVSIHNNSSESGNFTSTHGTQVLYSESNDAKLSGKRFAKICLDSTVKALGSHNVGLMAGDKIYIIRTSEVPAALVEVGFMTNHEELDKLNDPAYQKKAAKGIYRAIKKAFEEGF